MTEYGNYNFNIESSMAIFSPKAVYTLDGLYRVDSFNFFERARYEMQDETVNQEEHGSFID